MGHHEGAIRNITCRADCLLNIETPLDRNVIFGKREDGQGYWHGSIGILAENQMVVKLSVCSDDTIIFGTRMGRIEDFDGCDARLFMGIDRKIYYTSIGLSGEFDHGGWPMYYVSQLGSFDLREYRSDRILFQEVSSIRMGLLGPPLF